MYIYLYTSLVLSLAGQAPYKAPSSRVDSSVIEGVYYICLMGQGVFLVDLQALPAYRRTV